MASLGDSPSFNLAFERSLYASRQSENGEIHPYALAVIARSQVEDPRADEEQASIAFPDRRVDVAVLLSLYAARQAEGNPVHPYVATARAAVERHEGEGHPIVEDALPLGFDLKGTL